MANSRGLFRRKNGWLSILLVILILSSCQSQQTDSPAVQEFQPDPSSVPVVESPAEPQPPAPTEATFFSTEQGELPLRFTLPTPGQAPISLWRPPLYNTPWALSPFDHFYFNRPIAADEVNWPAADYRYGGVFFGSDIVHTGIDIPTPRGTPVLAAASGRVIWAGYGLFYGNNDPQDPYGLAVTIRHDFGHQGQRLYTVYAHMSEIKVKVGQEVKTGDVLGLVGTTGLTTGPHLHFEVRMESNSYFATYNPELWLAPPQGWGVLAGKVLNTNGSLLTGQDVLVRNKDTRQKWVVRSYGNQAVNSDLYYQENIVLSDLPAGKYEITIDYLEDRFQTDIEIFPGAVSYFKFRGKLYFETTLPSAPSIDDIIGVDLP
jgi:murein DD-endopeptidase MepM/ murein hydrolase activator NlpD